jgi:hypothetical protein
VFALAHGDSLFFGDSVKFGKMNVDTARVSNQLFAFSVDKCHFVL